MENLIYCSRCDEFVRDSDVFEDLGNRKAVESMDILVLAYERMADYHKSFLPGESNWQTFLNHQACREHYDNAVVQLNLIKAARALLGEKANDNSTG